MQHAKHLRRLAAGTAMAVMGLSGSAVAQNSADGGFLLEEIIVTAQKRVQNLQDVPVAISVVTGDQLEQANINSAEQLFQRVPTITFRKGNTNKDSAISIRGVGTISFASGVEPSVSTVIDGVVYARAGQQTADFLDLERVEVLRGPQGSIFGKNASAGVVNITTRSPSSTPKGFAEASYYEGNEYRLKAGVSGPLSDKLSGLVTGFFSHFDGNGKNVFNGHDVNGYERYGARMKLVLDATENVTFTAIADYAKGNDNGYADSIGTVFPGAYQDQIFKPSLAPLTPGAKNKDIDNDLDPKTRDKNSGVSLQADIDLGTAAITSITAYRHWYNYQQRDGDFRSDAPLYVATGAAASDVRSHDRGDLSFDQFTQELRIASTGQNFIDYVAGVYYYTTKEVDFFNRTVTACTATTLAAVNGLLPCRAGASTFTTNEGNADFTTKLKNYAAFGQATVNFTDDFRAILGGRYTEDKVSFDFARRSTSTAAFPGVRPAFTATGTTKQDGISGNAGLQYDFADDIIGYATYTRGYKGPALNVFFNMIGTDTLPISEETSNAYEAGLKTRFPEAGLMLNLAAFKTVYDGYQANNLELVAGQVVTRLTNAGSVSTRGLEADFTWAASRDLEFNGGVSYTKARIDKFKCPTTNPTCADAINGKPLPFSAKWKGSVTADWRLPVDLPNGDLNLSNTVQFTSKQGFDINQNPNAVQSGYSTWDAVLAWTSDDDKYRLSLIAKNITDKQYVILRIPNGTAFMRQITPRDSERYFGASARVNF
ncbi:TonB-dependent receptor [Niveispirillum cyanobacteriorum]|nr:TonB-dependent receptor [Niveispirillum cyanobacteriorum]GGE67934.1 TonB-dependent receptor [Niveispirillum cyanobacteriorum]